MSHGNTRFLLLLSTLVLSVCPAYSQLLYEDCPGYYRYGLLDQVSINPFEDKILAIDALTGGIVAEKLLGREYVISYAARGLVGAVVTNQRLLGFSARSGGWYSRQLLGNEAPTPEGIRISPRLALVVTTRRAYILDPDGAGWIHAELNSFDFPLKSYLSSGVGLVVTPTRALAYSSPPCADAIGAIGFFRAWKPVDLRIKEPVLVVNINDSLATMDTKNKLLIFNGLTGTWRTKERLF